jgi:hypothetical protein
MAGKKYLNPDHFGDGSDNENMYFGFDNDICRDTYSPPMQDLAGFPDQQRLGSNHTGGVNMLYCEGSVGHLLQRGPGYPQERGQPQSIGSTYPTRVMRAASPRGPESRSRQIATNRGLAQENVE